MSDGWEFVLKQVPVFLNVIEHLDPQSVKKLVRVCKSFSVHKHFIPVRAKIFIANTRKGGCEMIEAAQRDDVDVLNWMYERGYRASGIASLYRAAKHGRLEAFKWLVEHGSVATKSVVNAAAHDGNYNILQWLVDGGFDFGHISADNLVLRKQLDMVRWLYNRGHKPSPHYAMKWASISDDPEMLEFLYKRGYTFFGSAPHRDAVNLGKFASLEWMHTRGLLYNSRVADHAVGCGRVDVLEWLYERGYKCTAQAIDEAKGNVELLVWLRDHGLRAAKKALADLGVVEKRESSKRKR